MEDCIRCSLSKSRTKIVNGSGPKSARIVFVGEAPGEQEDLKGVPFVGRAGQFLDSMLAEVGIERSRVFITNVVRCRPPSNRKPRDDEIERCLLNLAAELSELRPKIVVALGSVALKALTGCTGQLSAMIGKEFEAKRVGMDLTVLACYHPSAAMRNRKMRDSFKALLSKVASRID